LRNLRKYGQSPFDVAVIHGGPGAAGEMAPVAQVLAFERGVLEPLQTASSLKGQIKELKTVLERYGKLPVILIGFSWGAWLSFIFTAKYSALINKLILIGSGPFEEKYAARIQETRLNRLSEEDRKEFKSLFDRLNNPASREKGGTFERFGALSSQADAFDPVTYESEIIDMRANIFQSVWKHAAGLRKSGKLLALGKRIKCPVVAIHGNYDPHPAEGVQKPLSVILGDFRFILLENCGHKPWIEQQAKDKFYSILKEEVQY